MTSTKIKHILNDRSHDYQVRAAMYRNATHRRYNHNRWIELQQEARKVIDNQTITESMRNILLCDINEERINIADWEAFYHPNE